VGHRTRRAILRALASGTDALSPSQLIQDGAVDASVAAVSYHAKVLVKTGSIIVATENWSSGSTQCFYRSVVRDDPQVKRILQAMASADRSVGPLA
jgi:DNA-binding transcriptional ArsR family regulator